MTRKHDDLARALKQLHVTCRRAGHKLGWIHSRLVAGDRATRGEEAREAALQLADELEELVNALRSACVVEGEDPT